MPERIIGDPRWPEARRPSRDPMPNFSDDLIRRAAKIIGNSGLRITYSEDFRENTVPSEVYSRLIQAGYNPLTVTVEYSPKLGEGRATYLFKGRVHLEKSRLRDLLNGINFQKLYIKR